MSQPLIWPVSGDTTSTSAPASLSLASGTSSSDCSNPCVARIATRLPDSFIVRLLKHAPRAHLMCVGQGLGARDVPAKNGCACVGSNQRVASARSIKRVLTQQCDQHQQKHGQREAEHENDALPGPAQNNFAPARLLGRVGWGLCGFLSDHCFLAYRERCDAPVVPT